jgi:hypothetical protein
MKKYLLFFILTLAFMLLAAHVVMSQPVVQFKQPITFSVTGFSDQVMYIGINSGDGIIPASTYDQDVGAEMGVTGTWKELLYPSYPMGWSFIPTFQEIPSRIATPPVWSCKNMRPYDYRGYSSPTQVDTFQILVRTGDQLWDGFPATGITLSWPSSLGAFGSWKLLRKTSSSPDPLETFVEELPFMELSGTSYTDISAGEEILIYYMIIRYGERTRPDPYLYMNTSMLKFSTVSIEESATKSITVTNTSVLNTLTITGVTSIANYSIVPNPPSSYPMNIAPGTSRNFDVTFTPTSLGTIAGNIVFTHNPIGRTTNLFVTGKGISKFALSQSSLDFGTVAIGSSKTESITVTNVGTTNTLTITSVSSVTGYIVAPNPPITYPITLAPGASQNFDVTFTPTTLGGPFGGNIVFKHNAIGGTTNLPVTGNCKDKIVQFKIPIYFSAVGDPSVQTLWLGINSGDGVIPANTYGQDVGSEMGVTGTWKELLYISGEMSPNYSLLPFFIEIPSRFTVPPVWSSKLMRPYDYRGYSSPSQIDTFQINVKCGDRLPDGFPATGLTLSWSNLSDNFTQMTLLKKMTSTTYEVKVAHMESITSWTDNDPAKTVGQLSVTYLIIKTGAFMPPPGPCIDLNPGTLDFGRIDTDDVLPVTVYNHCMNQLTISNIAMPFTCYTLIEPLPIVIPGVSSTTIHIKFAAPTEAGIFNGNAQIYHNGTNATSPMDYELKSNTLGGQLEIAPIGTVLDNSAVDGGAYEAIIQFASYTGAPLRAVQFTLVTKGKTIIGPISKTGAFLTSDWVLNTNVVSRTAQTDGSSIDTVNVLLYGIGTTALGPISVATPALTFRYNVINIAGGTEQAEMCLISILGSTTTAADAALNTSACETIDIMNRTYWGDVNSDDRVDILDLLMVADHITGRHLLEADQITRANVGNWPASLHTPNQTPPINIDVMDLVKLQSIIMDGHYPDGTTTTGTPKLVASAMAKSSFDASVKFYTTKKGIAIYVSNNLPLKGMQVVFTGIINKPTGINSSFTQCSAQINEEQKMRFILFDQNCVGLGRGNRTVAEIEMQIDQPLTIGVEELLAADNNNTVLRLERENGEIVFGEAPPIPIEWSLSQNYPNPFNPTTNITFSIPEPSDVRIMIYNMLGQEVRELFAGQLQRGTNTISWDGKDMSGRALASGTYIYRMTAGSFIESKKMIILR